MFIQRISTSRNQQKIALVLFSVMYLELFLPFLASAYSGNPHRYYQPKNQSAYSSNRKKQSSQNPLSFAEMSKTKTQKQTFAKPQNTVLLGSGFSTKEEQKNFKHRLPGGPTQPEMNSFQSVNTNNMVDLFSGDFSYNIPLMDVGGYPVNIHYTGGISMDQEASWVGLGWNINPGVINRNMRGLPDDFKGDTVTKIQHIKANKTFGLTVGEDIELFGLPIGASGSVGVFHNNYNGFGLEYGVNASVNILKGASGSLTGNLGLSNNSQTGIDISPSFSYTLEKTNSKWTTGGSLGTSYNSRTGLSGLQLSTEVKKNRENNMKASKESQKGSLSIGGGISSSISFATPSYSPSISMPFTNSGFSFTLKLGKEIWPAHPGFFARGYVSKQEIKDVDTLQKLPAFGYLQSTASVSTERALMDFNRDKEVYFNASNTPNIAIPSYSYDILSVSGEGTGGSFRPYRGDVGIIRDHRMNTKNDNSNFSLDVGAGNLFHGGVNLNWNFSGTTNKSWNDNNDISPNISFRENDSNYQAVYFRNPGEKAINATQYYNSIGDDKLMRVAISGDGFFNDNIKAESGFTVYRGGQPAENIPVSAPIVKKERDKRTQVFSYLNATEAATYGLDKQLRSYKLNSIPVGTCADSFAIIKRVDAQYRKPHHMNEVTVLNGDGRRYVYGLPIYTVEQKDVNFAVEKETNVGDINKGLANYTPNVDNTSKNQRGKDNAYTNDIMPAYAHAFLLSGILSNDYVDIKNDGITDDDLGDAVKFNYTRLFGLSNSTYNTLYQWRLPVDQNKANYNEGLKTYSRDDKASYMYGKKEIWYMNSIESKTMVAVFITSNRQDAIGVTDENGGIGGNSLKKLDRIELYAKSDLIQDKINATAKAKPIKTVNFEYTEELCTGIYPGIPTLGKLTLRKIWFSYNKNNKGQQNPYVFYYSPNANGTHNNATNKTYHPKKYDRWGNYKDESSNPGGLNNVDYPYSIQDSTIAAGNAKAWQLSDIQLPSGGRIKVTYESDDYGYVQNKRATQMIKIAGVSSSLSNAPNKYLYDNPSFSGLGSDAYYVFVNVDQPLVSNKDIFYKYLEGIEKFYFKLAVKMPSDRWGSGYEFVPTYGQLADANSYGIVPGNNKQFWMQLKPVDGGSPLTKAAIQFLRMNLKSKAYPSSEVGDNIDLGDAVQMLVSSFDEIKKIVRGFYNDAKTQGHCKELDITKSFIRLDNPYHKKLGGGYRVKRVEIYDNWNAMTGQKESRYGQEYTYTTQIEVDGQPKMISSGVASYEPQIGSDENPFRIPLEYDEQIAPLAPTDNLYTEMPLGENYFPSAGIGYSKVRVRTINAKTRSANGWEESEFFTTKDFPTIAEFTPLDVYSKLRYESPLGNFLKIYSKKSMTVSQGFKIELNDMNGKMKAQATYAETDSIKPIRYTQNFYKLDNDTAAQGHLNNEVWVVDSLNGHINKKGIIGKDAEIIVDMREQVSTSFSPSVALDVDVIPLGLIPLPVLSVIPMASFEQNRFRSAATVKVINRYGILDSVMVMDKGSVVNTKNLVYDGETGEVVLSRTNNEFNDPIYNFNYPAHWAYSGMSSAYKNLGVVLKYKYIIDGKLFEQDGVTVSSTKYFESGDEIWVNGYEQNGTNLINNCPFPNITAAFINGAKSFKLWALDASKGKLGHQGLIFIKEDGTPFGGYLFTMEIIRSGKRNMLDASVGSVMMMANPIKDLTVGNPYIVIDSFARVINVSANKYKDLWQVENSLYPIDSCYSKWDTSAVLYYTTPNKTATIRSFILDLNKERSFLINPPKNLIDSSYFSAGSEFKTYGGALGGGFYHFRNKGIMQFDFANGGYAYENPPVPTNAQVIFANLNLKAWTPKGVWRYTGSSAPNNNDWNYFTSAHLLSGNNTADRNKTFISQVTIPWNASTPFDNIVTSTPRVSIPSQLEGTNNNVLNVDVKLIVQNMVQTPANNQGFLISLQNDFPNPFILSPFSNPEFKMIVGFKSKNCRSIPGHLDCDSDTLLKMQYRIQKDTCVQLCRNNIDTLKTNPYRWGILGNWRMDRAYTYYFDRKESDATASLLTTNIRKEGELKSFIPYWQLNNAGLKATTDTFKWVWNSAMSMFNKKGFEIENYDPLGRYNAGLYGYRQSIPVAVAQNAKYREILFDGFEDYEYTTNNCAKCPPPREFDFVKGNTGVSINKTEQHTGKASLKVLANSTSTLTANLVHDTMDRKQASLFIKIDSTPVLQRTVTGKGLGLAASYNGVPVQNCGSNTIVNGLNTRIDPTINFNWGTNAPYTNMCAVPYTVYWNGYVQPKYTDNFIFYVRSDQGYQTNIVYLNNQQLIFGTNAAGELQSQPIALAAGTINRLEIYYRHAPYFLFNIPAYEQVSWSSTTFQSKEIIPQTALYKFPFLATDSAGSMITTIQKFCVKANAVKGDTIIRPVFSPIRNKRMIISGWVKMDGNDCNTAAALDNIIEASFDNGAPGTTVNLARTGVRIEGWQRYEAIVTMPPLATKLFLKLKGVAGRALYFDDVRVQPYNSSMKGFVYDPVNLRLMAELDENNYATFYEYDDDGTLIRLKKETVRGIKTIKETRSALVK
jgi:PA14 domain